ncbi:MAG: ABC transporter ATP-binding protein [Acidimicrobiales bacterium]
MTNIDLIAPAPPVPPTVRPIAARARKATKIYATGEASVRALDSVDIDIDAGRFTAVMGPSGSGKSTLMQCLAGLDDLTSGQVFIGDIDMASLSEKRRTLVRREKVGFIFQAFNLIPTLSAIENMTLPLDLAGIVPNEEWLATVVRTVGLENRLHHRPDELSGGQRQRVAVARALVARPSIIFADEPTGNLDSRSGAEILSFMRSAVDTMGQTIVMVTHDPVAASYADRAVFLADGKIVDEVQQPTAQRVLDLMKGMGN